MFKILRKINSRNGTYIGHNIFKKLCMFVFIREWLPIATNCYHNLRKSTLYLHRECFQTQCNADNKKVQCWQYQGSQNSLGSSMGYLQVLWFPQKYIRLNHHQSNWSPIQTVFLTLPIRSHNISSGSPKLCWIMQLLNRKLSHIYIYIFISHILNM